MWAAAGVGVCVGVGAGVGVGVGVGCKGVLRANAKGLTPTPGATATGMERAQPEAWHCGASAAPARYTGLRTQV